MTHELTVGWIANSRGHYIAHTSLGLRYVDPEKALVQEPVGDTPDTQRPCVLCGRPPTADFHDACIANLDEVRDACCGHGNRDEAYVSFDDGRVLREADALAFFREVGAARGRNATLPEVAG